MTHSLATIKQRNKYRNILFGLSDGVLDDFRHYTWLGPVDDEESPLVSFLCALEEMSAEIKFLIAHDHEWDDDHCMHCGMDGQLPQKSKV